MNNWLVWFVLLVQLKFFENQAVPPEEIQGTGVNDKTPQAVHSVSCSLPNGGGPKWGSPWSLLGRGGGVVVLSV